MRKNIPSRGVGRRFPLAGSLAVLLGLAAGAARAQTISFGPGTTYSTGPDTYPTHLVVADVNLDGKLDALMALGSSGVGLLLGNGNGTFQAVTEISMVLKGPIDFVVGDLNNDGKPDLLANMGSNLLVTRLGNGDGTFQSPTTALATTRSGYSTNQLALGDMDNDGKLDLVATDSYAKVVMVLRGTGTGAFRTAAMYSMGGNTYGQALALTDLNADGRLDVVTDNEGIYNASTDGSFIILLGTGNGALAAPAYEGIGAEYSGPRGIAVGDANNDDKPDVFTTFVPSYNVYPRLGKGDGTFRYASPVSTRPPNDSPYPRNVIASDVNGDGRLDLLANCAATNGGARSSVAVLAGNGNGTFKDPVGVLITPSVSLPNQLAAADVNSDGRPDILWVDNKNFLLGVLLNTSTYAVPSLTSLSAATGQPGTTITLTGTNLAGATSVRFNGSSAPFTVVSGTAITATVPVGATSGNVTVSTPGGTTNGLPFTVTYPDLVISTAGQTIAAGIYNSITVQNGGSATLVGNVTVNGAVTVQNGGTLYDGCYALSGAGSFTLAAGGTLGICAATGISSSGTTGAVQSTGTRTFSPDASYVYNGVGAQSTGPGLPSQVRNLTTTNGSPVTLTSPVGVTQVVTVGGAGNLVSNAALTLLSSAGGTALLVNSGSGVVSGATTIQRYIDPSLNPSTAANPGGQGYRHYSSPVSNSTVGDLATTTFTPVLTQGYNTSPTPGTTTPFPNVFGYDQSRLATVSNNYAAFDKGWVVPAAATTALVPGQGYAVNIAGTELVDFVGTPNTGDLTVTLSRNGGSTAADAGWALVGNPYPAPLDYSQLQAADLQGVDRAMYVQQSTGQYAGQYRSYVNGTSTSAANGPLIAAGQGFFVRVSQGQTSGSLTFRNAQRVTSYGQQPAFQRPAADPRPSVRLELTGAGLADAFVAYAEAGASAGFEASFDAVKLPNPTGLNLSSAAASGQRLAIDGRPAFAAATALPLQVGVPAAGTY